MTVIVIDILADQSIVCQALCDGGGKGSAR